MATHTAPVVNGTPSKKLVTMHFVDASGDQKSVSLWVDGTTVDADIQTFIATYRPLTQASNFKVSVTEVYEGDNDPDNADALQRSGVENGINMLWKEAASGDTVALRVIAPVETLLLGNQDVPDMTGIPIGLWIAEVNGLLPTYNLQSAQYTTRRERNANNTKVKL